MFEKLLISQPPQSWWTLKTKLTLATFSVIIAILLTMLHYSIKWHDMDIPGLDDEIALVQPVPVTLNAPQPLPEKKLPQPSRPQASQQAAPTQTSEPERKVVGPKGSVVKVPTEGDDGPTDTVIGGNTSGKGDAKQGDENRTGTSDGKEQVAQYVPEKTPEPIPERTPEPTPDPTPRKDPTPQVEQTPPPVKTGGVVNGNATNLVKPRQAPVGAPFTGTVRVAVLISEKGKVTSANVTFSNPGNISPLLRSNIVQAAKASSFKPTTLSGIPVKVSGEIVYNFTQ